MENIENRNIRIYKKYIEKKENGGKISDLSNEFNVSRGTIYSAIHRVRVGNIPSLRRCLSAGRLECVWKHKYKARFLILPMNRSATTMKELQKIIRLMKEDGFPIKMIAEKLGKERSTILHHLAKNER